MQKDKNSFSFVHFTQNLNASSQSSKYVMALNMEPECRCRIEADFIWVYTPILKFRTSPHIYKITFKSVKFMIIRFKLQNARKINPCINGLPTYGGYKR
jgi:hypothetical protein